MCVVTIAYMDAVNKGECYLTTKGEMLPDHVPYITIFSRALYFSEFSE